MAEDVVRSLRREPTVPAPEEEAVFFASLKTSWGVLGLLSMDNQGWLIRKERHLPLVHAALSFWDELDAVGPRYYWTTQPERLWRVAQGLKYVLAHMGVRNDTLNAPLPPEGPRALLRYAHTHAEA